MWFFNFCAELHHGLPQWKPTVTLSSGESTWKSDVVNFLNRQVT